MVGVELQDVAGGGSAQVLVDLGDHCAGSHLVEVVGGGESLNRLTLEGAVNVDGHLITVARRTVHRLEGRMLATQRLQLGVDILDGGLG